MVQSVCLTYNYIIMCIPINLSMARFMKGFKTLLTDLVCIVLRLFPSGSSKARGFIYHLYNIVRKCSVPTSYNVSLIRECHKPILHRKSIGEATPLFTSCFHTHISPVQTCIYLKLNHLGKGSASLKTLGAGLSHLPL